ncbi:MAG: endonuclease/exonuclease/phosphatase family protein [Frankia sp.]
MRLASFNLMHARSLTDGLVDGDRLVTAVAGLRADVLALQEVDRDQPRSGGLDLTALAARAMGVGPGDHRFEPALLGTPGESWRPATDAAPASPRPLETPVPTTVAPETAPAPPRPRETLAPAAIAPVARAPATPAYGVGLVSRFPVEEWRVVRLPAAPVRSPVVVPAGPRRVRVLMLDDEPRVGLVAVLATPTGRLTVVSTHLSFVPGWNVVQLRRLVAALRDLPDPVVLLGDLNLPGAVARLASGWRSLATAATYPSPRPRVQLDHALARGRLPAVTRVVAERTPISDHRALLVDLAAAAPPAPDQGW